MHRGVLSGMATHCSAAAEAASDDLDCAAEGPHCGVCGHAAFTGWDLTPLCTRWNEPTAVTVGVVCEAFDPVPDVVVGAD